jgi:hypothetical protein
MEPQASTPAPTTNWPGAFGIYKDSKRAVRLNIWPIVGVYAAVLAVTIIASTLLDPATKESGDAPAWLTLFSFLVNLIISAVSGVAVTDLVLSGVKGEKLTFKQSFRKVASLWLKMIGLFVLLYIITIVSLLAFIIPFFFVFPRVALAPYFLVDKEMGPVEAIKASWALTKGNVGKVWGIIGATLAMVLLMFTIIGIPFAIYFLIMYSASYAVLYMYLHGQPVGEVETAAPASVQTAETSPMPSEDAPSQE